MRKFNFKRIKIKKVRLEDISDHTLMLNLYVTQAVTLLLGAIIILFQDQSWSAMLSVPNLFDVVLWGGLLAATVVAANLLVSKIVPEDIIDDGGINERLFGNKSVFYIAVISLVVAICEEILFRGAIQYILGPYWTSIVFAAIHVRYLSHWIMTGFVFATSYALGWVYVHTGTLWTPIFAHFWIDFILGCVLRFSGGKSKHGSK